MALAKRWRQALEGHLIYNILRIMKVSEILKWYFHAHLQRKLSKWLAGFFFAWREECSWRGGSF
jgi:hypothetical protein